MSALPVITDCNGCGACCMRLVYPPFVRMPPGFPDDQQDPSWLKLEAERPDLVADYEREYDKRQVLYEQRRQAGTEIEVEEPCHWFDVEARKCKHHDYRPDICKEFEVGSYSCRKFRVEFKVDPANTPIGSEDEDYEMDTTTGNSVLQREFRNRSKMLFSFANDNADRVRGISCDLIKIDDEEDEVEDNVKFVLFGFDPDDYKLLGEESAHYTAKHFDASGRWVGPEPTSNSSREGAIIAEALRELHEYRAMLAADAKGEH